jgi:formate hydrogenlyase subunit 6/NADH:ubiquinone oxidoreductase subunit I
VTKGRVVVELIRNLGRKPATVLYPKEAVPIPLGFRGRIAIRDELCIGCSKCAVVCPTECISMVASERQVHFGGKALIRKRKPEVHLFACIRCGLCEEYCPTDPKAIYLTAEPSGSGTDKDVVVR